MLYMRFGVWMLCVCLYGCIKTSVPPTHGKFCIDTHPKNTTVYVNDAHMTKCQVLPIGEHIQVSAQADGFHDFEHSFVFHGTMTYDIYMKPRLLDEGVLE